MRSFTAATRDVTPPGSRLAGVLALAAFAWGCGGLPPDFPALGDQVAVVEREFALELYAADPEGRGVAFGFRAPDLPEVGARARISPDRPGAATFRWTPIISDVGRHRFEFTADDGRRRSTQAIMIDVRLTEGGGTGPTFVRPEGTGLTLDLARQACASFDVVVADPDSAAVTITQGEPRIPGATLTPDAALTAQFTWCPTPAQAAGMDRVVVHLAANDGTTMVVKDYLIVLRRPQRSDCPGGFPVVVAVDDYDGTAVTTLLPVVLHADVSDDLGLKDQPLLYYSLSNPGPTPDVTRMTQVTMSLVQGDIRSGRWVAELPNPVVELPVGTSADLWYVIAAQDDDDWQGDCDHLTQAPAVGSSTLRVTRPAGEAGRALCAACTADAQCGGPEDHCLVIGEGGASYCSRACAEDGDCGDPLYYCSQDPWLSVDGASARQCIPTTFRCPPDLSCLEDAYEPDDLPSQARGVDLTNGLFATGNSICPGNDDWFAVQLDAGQALFATLAFAQSDSRQDLDLRFYRQSDLGPVDLVGCTEADPSGCSSDNGQSATANENFTFTAENAGTYYVVVHGWNGAANQYDLCIAASAAAGWGCPPLPK
jgi:hypothetical protein